MLYAQVAVNSGAPYRHPFTYSVPPELALAPGHVVLVPFGARTLEGVVVQITAEPAFEGEIRAVLARAPELPDLPAHLIELAHWIADRYCAPIYSCVSLLLPPGAERRADVRLVPTEGSPPEADPERTILQALHSGQAGNVDELRRTLALPRLAATVGAMERAGLVRREFRLGPARARPRIVRAVRLRDAGAMRDADEPLLASLHAAGGSLPLSVLRGIPEFNEAELRRLIEVGWLELVEARVYRDPLAGAKYPLRPAPALTPAQAEAVAQILASDNLGRPCLLHGVTGSGKTEVYLAATAATLKAGRQAVILVPEISLTPQTVERFAGRFPGRVAVLHSGLPNGQRYDQWCRIQEGHCDVVIGSRSAIFAPLSRLGLIVLDEEHEWTYKQQDPQPRYQTRDVAMRLAGLVQAALVLGSATPDVCTYYRAERGAYRLLQLPDRVLPRDDGGGSAGLLPHVEVVDLSDELRAGNRSIFSRTLADALAACLKRGEQALLFLNRRGSAGFLLCRDCGHVPRCRRCSLSLTYHAEGERLLCHLCGAKRRAPVVCPRCGSARIRRIGLGTERVVEEVGRRFPNARVVRWDRDSARNAADHAALFAALTGGEADVLVGTQMVAKGLDLPRLTLVGIVNADLSLNFPEYGSIERAFQHLMQVAGRAGRRNVPGNVVLQTYAPAHYAVRAAAAQDYAAFYATEIAYRRRGAYPPFARLTRLVYAGSGAAHVEREARRLAAEIRRSIEAGLGEQASIVGPAPCLTARLRGRSRWQVLLRSPNPTAILERLPLRAGWSVDIDPEAFV